MICLAYTLVRDNKPTTVVSFFSNYQSAKECIVRSLLPSHDDGLVVRRPDTQETEEERRRLG
jgi:hypothetical protein